MFQLSTKQIALASVFAGFYYLLSFLPGIPAPGIAAININIGACMATVFGYILGPLLGGTATLLGVIIAWALPPGNASLQGIFFLPSPVLNAIVSGLLYQRRWKAASIGLVALIVAFWFTPPIQPMSEFWGVGVAVTWDKIIALSLIIPLILLDRHGRSSVVDIPVQTRDVSSVKSGKASFLFIVSSLLILSNSFLVVLTGGPLNFFGDPSNVLGYRSLLTLLGNLNSIWIVFGLISLVASIMFYLIPQKRRLLTVLIVFVSLLSVFTGGGFILGVVLAIITGFYAFFSDVVLHQSMKRLEMLQLFLMAFIGNEADNMWGSLIFAFPLIYETVFSLNSDIVRYLFLLSPFAYPAIRFLQAIIATLVAVPLIRTLKAAKIMPR